HSPPLRFSTLFPYTTLFRSVLVGDCAALLADLAVPGDERVDLLGHRRRVGLALGVLGGGRVVAVVGAREEHHIHLPPVELEVVVDRKSTRLNSSHDQISYAV